MYQNSATSIDTDAPSHGSMPTSGPATTDAAAPAAASAIDRHAAIALEDSDEIRARDDERLVGLEVAHEDRRVVRRDHRRQQVDRRRDVDERKRRLHDRLDR